MAPKTLLFFVFLIVSSVLTSSIHGRKLSTNVERQNKAPTLFDRLYMAALPKGTVPASGPTKKGHAFTVDEKLVARNLRAVDRILFRSVPSPSTGN